MKHDFDRLFSEKGLLESLTPRERVRLIRSLQEAGSFFHAAERFLEHGLDDLAVKCFARGFLYLGFAGDDISLSAIYDAVTRMKNTAGVWRL